MLVRGTPSTTLEIWNIVAILHPEFKHAIGIVKRFPLEYRTVLIKCCQAQRIPQDNEQTVLSDMIRALPYFYHPAVHKEPIAPFAIFNSLRGHYSVVTYAILLDLARSLPLPYKEREDAKMKGWNKEIVCCESEPEPLRIYWKPIFDPSLAEIPLLPELRPNRKMNLNIYSCLVRWRYKISNRLLYPKMKAKNMSRDTRRHYEEQIGGYGSLDDVPIFGRTTWQRIYMETGVKLSGACEM